MFALLFFLRYVQSMSKKYYTCFKKKSKGEIKKMKGYNSFKRETKHLLQMRKGLHSFSFQIKYVISKKYLHYVKNHISCKNHAQRDAGGCFM